MPRILIVDDDDAMRTVIREHLSSTYQIIETGFPENALVIAVEQEPDVILLDLWMPGVSGFELCQALSAVSFTQRIPIFVISAQDERNKAFCQNLGAYRYFTKPINFSKLKADLASVLSERKTQRRRDVRVQAKILLKLKGRNKNGTDFEVRAETENVSKSGFLCASPASLEDATAVEVFLYGEREHRLGDARLVRVASSDCSGLRYGFQFTGLWEKPLIGAT